MNMDFTQFLQSADVLIPYTILGMISMFYLIGSNSLVTNPHEYSIRSYFGRISGNIISQWCYNVGLTKMEVNFLMVFKKQIWIYK